MRNYSVETIYLGTCARTDSFLNSNFPDIYSELSQPYGFHVPVNKDLDLMNINSRNLFSNLQSINMSFSVVIHNGIWIIIGAVLALVIAYFYFKSKIDLNAVSEKKVISGTVGTEQAVINIGQYRKNWAYASLSLHRRAKVEGVLHFGDKFGEYATTFLNTFKREHPLPIGLMWEIAIYPFICKSCFNNRDQPRVGVYFIPTLVKGDTREPQPKDILDFYEVWRKNLDEKKYYMKKSSSQASSTPAKDVDNNFVFDEGQLWP